MKSINSRKARFLHALILAVVVSLLAPTMLWAANDKHVVQAGETLSQIAVEYDVTIAALLQANGLIDANLVKVGQALVIPSASNASTDAEVEDVVQVELDEITDAEAADLLVDDESSAYVTVQPGETLSQIALRYGMNSSTLMGLNGLSNPNYVYVGQQLRVANADGEVTSMKDILPNWVSGQTHEVAYGESLGQIAELYGVKLSILMRFNDLQGAYDIYPGQELRIPEMPTLNLSDVDYTNAPPTGQRLLEVDLSGQWMTAWDGNKVFMHTLISSGMADTPTVLGRYSIYNKYEKQDMNGWGGPLPDVPWVMYFYDGFAFHGAYWHNSFGIPMSHGCVHLTPEQAKELYDWADVGTAVYVHW